MFGLELEYMLGRRTHFYLYFTSILFVGILQLIVSRERHSKDRCILDFIRFVEEFE